jgi:hypothetical protein
MKLPTILATVTLGLASLLPGCCVQEVDCRKHLDNSTFHAEAFKYPSGSQKIYLEHPLSAGNNISAWRDSENDLFEMTSLSSYSEFGSYGAGELETAFIETMRYGTVIKGCTD